MKILLDENVSVQLPLLHTFLQEKGYDVVAQRAIAPGIPDEDVIALATQLGRTIITFDTDFPILKFKHSRSMPFGAILIQESKEVVDNLIYMEDQLYAESTGSFTSVPVDHTE